MQSSVEFHLNRSCLDVDHAKFVTNEASFSCVVFFLSYDTLAVAFTLLVGYISLDQFSYFSVDKIKDRLRRNQTAIASKW